ELCLQHSSFLRRAVPPLHQGAVWRRPPAARFWFQAPRRSRGIAPRVFPEPLRTGLGSRGLPHRVELFVLPLSIPTQSLDWRLLSSPPPKPTVHGRLAREAPRLWTSL